MHILHKIFFIFLLPLIYIFSNIYSLIYISVPYIEINVAYYYYRVCRTSPFNDVFTSLSIFENPFPPPPSLHEAEVIISEGLIPHRRTSTTRFLARRSTVSPQRDNAARQRRRARLVIDFASATESDLAYSLHTKDDDSDGSGGAAYLPPLAAP